MAVVVKCGICGTQLKVRGKVYFRCCRIQQRISEHLVKIDPLESRIEAAKIRSVRWGIPQE